MTRIIQTGIFLMLVAQLDRLARHNRQGSFRTRARYYEAFKRFCAFLADTYRRIKTEKKVCLTGDCGDIRVAFFSDALSLLFFSFYSAVRVERKKKPMFSCDRGSMFFLLAGDCNYESFAVAIASSTLFRISCMAANSLSGKEPSLALRFAIS